MKNKLLILISRITAFFKKIQFLSLFKKAIDFIIKFWRKTVLTLFIFILLYYPIGAFVTHKIDNNLQFNASNIENNALNSVALAASLIEREVDKRLWTANLPFFFPASILDNMPSYQTGIISAISNFTEALAQHSDNDVNLNQTSKLLKYPPNIWIIDFSKSWLPMASTNKKYREAIRELRLYNANLASNKTIFYQNEFILNAVLNAITKDINSTLLSSVEQIQKGSKRFIDLNADNVFYYNKGKIYSYYLILTALENDFTKIIKAKNLINDWNEMLKSFSRTSLFKPFVVINAKPDASFVPSHLTGQAFYMMLANNKLDQISYKIGTRQ